MPLDLCHQWPRTRQPHPRPQRRTRWHDHHCRLTERLKPDPPEAMSAYTDRRHHVQSFLIRESLVDKAVMTATEAAVGGMLREAHVVKIGGRSILDAGRGVVYPVVETLARILATKKLILGVGGGVRTRHVFSIGLDLG